jgi:hypothetical protein
VPRWVDDPIAVYHNAEELIDILLCWPEEPHGIYWRNTGDEPVRTAMLFFTTERQMIVGLTVDGDRSTALEYLTRLAKTVDGHVVYITGEEPPPDTAAELIEFGAPGPCLTDQRHCPELTR